MEHIDLDDITDEMVRGCKLCMYSRAGKNAKEPLRSAGYERLAITMGYQGAIVIDSATVGRKYKIECMGQDWVQIADGYLVALGIGWIQRFLQGGFGDKVNNATRNIIKARTEGRRDYKITDIAVLGEAFAIEHEVQKFAEELEGCDAQYIKDAVDAYRSMSIDPFKELI